MTKDPATCEEFVEELFFHARAALDAVAALDAIKELPPHMRVIEAQEHAKLKVRPR